MKKPLSIITALGAAAALTACSAPDPLAGTDSVTEQVSLHPVTDYEADIAASARGLEYTASGHLLLSSVAEDYLSTTVHGVELTEDTVATTALRTAVVPQEDDGGTALAQLDDQRLRELSDAVAHAQTQSATGDDTAEADEQATELSYAMFDLARTRGQTGFGLTQTHNTQGDRDLSHVWQLGSAGATVMLDLSEPEDSDADPARIDRLLRGIEGSVGICAVPDDPAAIRQANTDEDGEPLVDASDLAATSTMALVTSSGSGALVIRDPVSTMDHTVIEATLPDQSTTLSFDDDGAQNPESAVLLGLGELDCLNTDVTTGTDDHVAIFATLNTDLAEAALAHREAVDAADEQLTEMIAEDDERDLGTSSLRAQSAAVVPEESGQIAIIDGGSGMVTTLAGSTEMIEAYPELEGKDLTSIAVDPETYHHTGGLDKAGQSWWQRILPGWITGGDDENNERTEKITAWVTYEDTPAIYEVQF